MKGTRSLYEVLVNRVPGIKDRYRQKRKHADTKIKRANAWICLLGWNISYYLLGNKKLGYMENYPFYETKQLYCEDSESGLSVKKSPREFAKELADYDVISFDVFDTLIFRPFSRPADLFFFLEEKVKYPCFRTIREEVEARGRTMLQKKKRHSEITLEDIYDLLSVETGLDQEKVMKLELELEETFCFANPYMLQVVMELTKYDKRMIITSDMYLGGTHIKELLRQCGYPEFGAYYVSCDYGKSKSKGDLYEFVKESEARLHCKEKISFIHVGDNQIADVQQAKEHGVKAIYYPNINSVGEEYRPQDMSAILGSIYRGLVNAHIHNGSKKYTREYEYGYIYGGLLVTGYCQFIHTYVRQNNMDKILFLARDGYVLKKAYEQLYPAETEKGAYVYWSRLAGTKLAAGHYKYDYFQKFLFQKVNQGYTIKSMLKTMEAEDMLEGMSRQLRLEESEEVTDRNVMKIWSYLAENWDLLLGHYTEQLEAGKRYFKTILTGCKSAVAVDVGWAGSGVVSLNYVVNEVWKFACPIKGLLAGTNTCHDEYTDITESFLQRGDLTAYLYSQRENRDIWKFHNPGKGHNLYLELLMDAPTGSFCGFYLNEAGEVECRFKEESRNYDKVREIQSGILDFVSAFDQVQKKAGFEIAISGRDAYAPFLSVFCDKANFMKDLEGMVDEEHVE